MDDRSIDQAVVAENFRLLAGKLTEGVGRALAALPVEPWMGKVLLAGAQQGCAQEALIIVAMATTDSVWISPRSSAKPLLRSCLLQNPGACCAWLALHPVLSVQAPLTQLARVGG